MSASAKWSDRILGWLVDLLRATAFLVASWAVGRLVFETWLDWV